MCGEMRATIADAAKVLVFRMLLLAHSETNGMNVFSYKTKQKIRL